MGNIISKNFQQIFIKIVLGLIALVFVFWGFGGYNTRNKVILASVNGVEISVTDHDKAYDRLYTNLRKQLSQLKGGVAEDFLASLNLKQKALDEIINKILLEEEAERLNLQVNVQEVKEAIKNYPEFQQDGRFNLEQYKYVLRQNRILPTEFEQGRKDMLLLTKLENIITDSVQVGEDEVLNEYKRRNEKVSIEFVAFNPIDYEKGVTATDEAVREYLTYPDGKDGKVKYESLKDYFIKNSSEFIVPEKVRVEVLAYENDDYAKKVALDEVDIKSYYDMNSDEFTLEEEVKASHILIKSEVTDDPQVTDDARKRAEDLLAKIKYGADFAEIAMKYSEDKETAANGGDLGWFKRGEGDWSIGMIAFPQEEGEVSEVTALKDGFHIIKTTGIKKERKKELDRVRDDIIKKLSLIKGTKLIESLTREARKAVYRTRDVAGYAKQSSVKLITPEPFAFSDKVEGIGKRNVFNREVFEVEEGDVSDIIDLNSGSYIVKVVKKLPSHTPEFEDVVDMVKEKVAFEISKAMADRNANKALEKVQTGATLADIAKEFDLKIDVASNFSRVGTSAPKIGVSEELVNTAFGLTKENPYPSKIFTVKNQRYLIKLTKRQEISLEEFKKDKALLQRQLKMDKADKIFAAYIGGLVENADIKVFKEL